MDSMVLLHHSIQTMGAEYISAAHCNFGLRGEESDGDEQLVVDYCKSQSVQCWTKTFDTQAFCSEQKLSIQEGARVLRYAWFEELCEEHDISVIYTAHHFNDSVETALINLMRGTGLKGLTGIPRQRGNIIRPIIDMTQEEIKSYAAEHHVPWREDSSNNSAKYQRNRVRHELVPLMHDINASFPSSMKETISYLLATQHALRDAVQRFKDDYCETSRDSMRIPVKELEAHGHPDIYLYEMLSEHGFTHGQLSDIVASERVGAQIIAEHWTLFRDRSHFILRSNKEVEQAVLDISVSGSYVYDKLEITVEVVEADQATLGSDPMVMYADCDKIKFPLHLRTWRQGDDMRPLGMTGRKKISDILIDSKVSLADKNEMIVVMDSERIVWLAGLRVSEDTKLDTGSQKALKVRVHRP